MNTNNTVFDRPIMTLSDLRRLGRQGDAILILDNGRQADIRPHYAVTRTRQWQGGHWKQARGDSSFSCDLSSY